MPFRIAHLSDLHLGSKLLPHRTDDLKEDAQSLEGLFSSLQRRRVDHVVVTGDITDNGDREGFKLLQDVADAHGYPASKRTILPGNHDVVGLRRYLARFPGAFPRVQLLFGGRIALIGLDSTCNDGIPPNPRGWMGDDELDDLEECLDRHSDAAVKVVAIHHHLWDVPDDDSLESVLRYAGLYGPLEGRGRLKRLLVKHGVQLALMGHAHTANEKCAASGLKMFIGGASLEVFGYYLFEFPSRNPKRFDYEWVDLCDHCFGSGRAACESCDEDGDIECDDCEEGELDCPEPDCSGGRVPCERCDGEGTVECGWCKGDGCGHCDDGERKCSACDGDGDRECSTCNGDGDVCCPTCGGSGHMVCPECDENGEVACEECDGG